MSPDGHWTVGKCHRVVRPLQAALSKLQDLERTYPSLLKYPYPDKGKEDIATFSTYNTHSEDRPSRLASQKFTYSTRRSGSTSGVFGPIVVSSYTGSTGAVKKKNKECSTSPVELFDEFKAKSSIEAYSCSLDVFRAFRQFLLMIGDNPRVSSLIERSSFEVGRCITMTEGKIPEEVWYGNTEPFAWYRKIITMGHGAELIVTNSKLLLPTFPAFILECVGNNNIHLASILAQHYMETLPVEDFWSGLKQLQYISDLTHLEGSFSLASIFQEISGRFTMGSIKASGLPSFLNTMRELNINTDAGSLDAMQATFLQCIQIIIRGARKIRKNPDELKACEQLLLSFTHLLVKYSNEDELATLLTYFSKSHYSEVSKCIKLYQEVNTKSVIQTLPQPSEKFLRAFSVLFSDFNTFKQIAEYLAPSHPKFVRNIAAHYIASGGKGLAAVEWQDNFEARLLSSSDKLSANAEQALDSWILEDEEESWEVSDAIGSEKYDDSESEDEIVLFGGYSKCIPETPKCDLSTKYSRILPDGIVEWSLRRSVGKAQGSSVVENSPLSTRSFGRIAAPLNYNDDVGRSPFRIINLDNDISMSPLASRSRKSSFSSDLELENMPKIIRRRSRKSFKKTLESVPTIQPACIPKSRTSQKALEELCENSLTDARDNQLSPVKPKRAFKRSRPTKQISICSETETEETINFPALSYSRTNRRIQHPRSKKIPVSDSSSDEERIMTAPKRRTRSRARVEDRLPSLSLSRDETEAGDDITEDEGALAEFEISTMSQPFEMMSDDDLLLQPSRPVLESKIVSSYSGKRKRGRPPKSKTGELKPFKRHCQSREIDASSFQETSFYDLEDEEDDISMLL